MAPKVLIIDDDVDLVAAMRVTLEADGFVVADAQDGRRGLQMLREEKPDVVILDVMMDEIDEGLQVAYQIRSDPATRDLPILMLTSVTQQTGLLMDPKRDEGFLPVNEFIEKPVSPRALLDLVRKHVGK